jgi:hypothetical protein
VRSHYALGAEIMDLAVWRWLKRIKAHKARFGDHVFTERKLGGYHHHGLCVEYINKHNERKTYVIHFVRDPTKYKCSHGHAEGVDTTNDETKLLRLTCFDCFVRPGHSLYRYEYDRGLLAAARATCSRTECKFTASEAQQRAIDHYNQQDFGKYNLALNNCETFPYFCKTGIRRSKQILHALPIIMIVTKSRWQLLSQGMGSGEFTMSTFGVTTR